MSQLPYAELFAGHDAGAYTLPDELLHLRDTYLKVQAQPYPQPPENSWETIARLAVETVDAVHNGTKLPDPAAIEKARQDERVYQDVLDMMASCLDIAASRLREAVHALGLVVITDHLKPAHDRVWQEYRAAWRILQEHGDTEPRRLLSAPSKVRKASDQCDQLAEQYRHLRTARAALALRGFSCPDDPSGKYLSIRNYHQLSPSRLFNARPPWHDLSTRQFLGWHAANGGQLWMPTPDEQAKAVLDEAPDNSPLRRAGAGF